MAASPSEAATSLRITAAGLTLDAGGFAAPESFAELAFQHFSRACLGERAFYKLYDAGHLEFGDARLQEGQQLFLLQLLIGFQDDDGDRDLTPLRIGGRDHGAFENCGVGEDGFFHFDGRNIFAAADDDVFLAIDDVM